MEKILLIAILLSSTVITHSQTSKVEGAWLWKDSTNTKSVSLFFNKDGSVIMNSGLSAEPIQVKNNRIGRYSLNKNGFLTIKWKDKTIERKAVIFISKNAIKLTLEENNGLQ